MQLQRRATLSALGALLVTQGIPQAARAAEPFKIGFMFLGPVGEVGWAHQHDQSRIAMEKELGGLVKVHAVANVNEGPDAERIARELSADGNKLLFAASFGYMKPVMSVARDNPDKSYLVASGYLTAPNFGGYNAKWYEGGYLAGTLAGKTTKSNVIGLVAAYPVPDVMWYLNAVALGARSVNPKATVNVVFVNSWFDPAKEREAAIALINQGADVITHFTDTAAVVAAAEERGVWSISFHSDMGHLAPKYYLTGVTHHWGAFYTRVAREVMAGTWKSGLFLGGLREGVVKMAPFGPGVSSEAANLVRAREKDIASGRLNVFAGPIKDQHGKVRVAAGAVYPDADLGKMNWFAQGVTGATGK